MSRETKFKPTVDDEKLIKWIRTNLLVRDPNKTYLFQDPESAIKVYGPMISSGDPEDLRAYITGSSKDELSWPLSSVMPQPVLDFAKKTFSPTMDARRFAIALGFTDTANSVKLARRIAGRIKARLSPAW